MQRTRRIPIWAAPRPLLALAILSAGALAQVSTVLPFHRTADLLVGDATSGRILRAHDADLDGAYASPGELSVYFDPAIAVNPATGSPYGSSLGSPSVITADRFGRIYVVGNATSPVVVRLQDLNGDGDANDLGESRIYANGAAIFGLAGCITRGAAVDPQGALWLTSDSGTDRVVKLTDLNNDGDVNDLGEATIVYDDGVAAGNGNAPLFNPAWAGFLPDGSFFLTNIASFHQFAVALHDLSIPPDGHYDGPGEPEIIYAGLQGNPAMKAPTCARIGPNGRLYLYDNLDKRLVVSHDGDGNLLFDDFGEAVVFVNSGDGGMNLGNGTQFDVRDDGAVIFADGLPTARLIAWRDLNFDGDAHDAGEQVVVLDFAASAFPTTDPRAVLFLPRDVQSIGVGCMTSTFTVPVLSRPTTSSLAKVGAQDFLLRLDGGPAGAAVGLLVSTAPSSVSLGALLPGLADLSCILWVDLFAPGADALNPGAFTDGFGGADVPLPIPAIPAIAGQSVYLQALMLDFGLAAPIVVSNGLELPLL